MGISVAKTFGRSNCFTRYYENEFSLKSFGYSVHSGSLKTVTGALMAKITLADKVRRNLERRNWSLKTVIAVVLFTMICLTFVFISDLRHPGMGAEGLGSVATVNNRYITAADLNEEVARLERSYSGFLGGNIGEMQRQFLQQQGLEFLIQSELLSQYAEKNGIFASDEEIRQMIMTELPYFQENGQFRRERYEMILSANRMTPADFEGKLRKDRKIQHLRQVFELSSTPMTMEKMRDAELEKTQVKYQYVKLDKTQSAQKLNISDSEVAERLKNPEFAKRVNDHFAAHAKEYDQPEQVRAAHILIKIDKNLPDSESKAKAKIEDIKKRLAKEDFGAIASRESEDLGSKTKKGDLGFFGHGAMVPEFEQAAFAQKVNEVGEPVKSEFGYHLIKVLEKKPAVQASLESFRPKVAKEMIAEEKFDGAAKNLEAQMMAGNAAEVDATLKSLGLTWQETPFIGLGADVIPGLDSPEALKAASELSPSKRQSPLVRDGAQKWIVRLKDIKQVASTDTPVASAKDRTKERGVDRMTRWVDQIKKSAKIERHLAVGTKNPQL